ncbi:pyridoxine/pyridoxamine 5'-phosphate oxidase 2 isoform X4 [Ricinus communis]|uniref:pyridoxine/pyridoxamine 5'-phosphate oxidase 2 isoform X4 n=1 Tax=Ricinus communis TaxID=3988 RepID=UPI00201A65AA|nr:pyridoxine/pyridoxamine 5'-phosphate oxidase 2 isoform X4 [Ricinus communis]
MEAASVKRVRVEFTPEALFLLSIGTLSIWRLFDNGYKDEKFENCRGFVERSDKIQINTDSRTRKTEELKQCSFAEICWYFTDSWEQFRINGRVDVIDGSDPDPVKLELREKSWFASSIKSRLQYLGPNPGLPCLTEQHPSELFLDPSSGPVAAFCLLVLDPEQVDYLNLKSSQRTIFTIGQRVNGENSWNSESINP